MVHYRMAPRKRLVGRQIGSMVGRSEVCQMEMKPGEWVESLVTQRIDSLDFPDSRF